MLGVERIISVIRTLSTWHGVEVKSFGVGKDVVDVIERPDRQLNVTRPSDVADGEGRRGIGRSIGVNNNVVDAIERRGSRKIRIRCPGWTSTCKSRRRFDY
jgi:hypothetical protein